MKVILLMALTVDGKIGKSQDHFPNWTGKADKQMFKNISLKAGAVIMGSKTFDTIGKPLPGRKNIVLTRNKERRSEWDNLIFSAKPPSAILEDLESEGYTEVILAGGAKINLLFAREGLIDEIIVTYVPKIFGSGLSLFAESVSMDLELLELKALCGDAIYAHYRVVRQPVAQGRGAAQST
jgi:dihydrofolate reductase